MLPIGIVIPTRNAAHIMRGHAAHLRSLLEHTAEAVVVDSSEDGTLDLLKRELDNSHVRFFRHPPGLYESWNYGISRLSTPYAYVSTAGDLVGRDGLEHLFQTAESLDAGIVVSPPEFRDETGAHLAEKRWPIHDLVRRRAINEPTVIDPWEVFLLQVVDAPKALIGSSAANLYRTDVLRRFPFPVDHGHFGDVAWGIEHAFSTRLAVTPSVVSRFVVHKSGGEMPICEIERARARLLALAMEVMDLQKGANAPAWAGMLRRLAGETSRAWSFQQSYDELRHGPVPWFLRPVAWQARRARKQQAQILATLKNELLVAGSSEVQRKTGPQTRHA